MLFPRHDEYILLQVQDVLCYKLQTFAAMHLQALVLSLDYSTRYKPLVELQMLGVASLAVHVLRQFRRDQVVRRDSRGYLIYLASQNLSLFYNRLVLVAWCCFVPLRLHQQSHAYRDHQHHE